MKRLDGPRLLLRWNIVGLAVKGSSAHRGQGTGESGRLRAVHRSGVTSSESSLRALAVEGGDDRCDTSAACHLPESLL